MSPRAPTLTDMREHAKVALKRKPLPLDVAIERYEYAGNREAHSAVTFSRWLSGWAALRAQGWDVVVLHGGDHAIGLGLYLGPAEPNERIGQLSLLSEVSA
jgi:hypothetical protein